MQAELASIESWVRGLPASRMVRPARARHLPKYAFWRLYTPLHPLVRDSVVATGLVRPGGRKDFLLGYVAPGQTIKEFVSYLVDKGYGNHFVAWHDEGQVVSLRYVEDFVYQYHVRVFEDGEVRGHYEYTPECHPVLHLKEIGLQDRREFFYRHLGDRIVRYGETSA